MAKPRRRNIPKFDKAYFTELERILPVRELLAFLYRQATPEDDRWARLADMIKSHPHTRPRLLASLAFDCRLSYQELAAGWIREQQLNGLMRQAEKVPQVLVDIADDSLSREVACPKCEGEGEVAREGPLEPGDATHVKCRLCKGAGTVHKMGDAQSREFLLKTQKLIDQQKGGGVTVNTQVNSAPPATAPSLADVLAQVRGALAPPVKALTEEVQ